MHDLGRCPGAEGVDRSHGESSKPTRSLSNKLAIDGQRAGGVKFESMDGHRCRVPPVSSASLPPFAGRPVPPTGSDAGSIRLTSRAAARANDPHCVDVYALRYTFLH
jgi:hypothetical protein